MHYDINYCISSIGPSLFLSWSTKKFNTRDNVSRVFLRLFDFCYSFLPKNLFLRLNISLKLPFFVFALFFKHFFSFSSSLSFVLWFSWRRFWVRLHVFNWETLSSIEGSDSIKLRIWSSRGQWVDWLWWTESIKSASLTFLRCLSPHDFYSRLPRWKTGLLQRMDKKLIPKKFRSWTEKFQSFEILRRCYQLSWTHMVLVHATLTTVGRS